MANQISDFFHGARPGEAPRDVATHLKRYWDPRMRKQIVAYYEERHGAGLTDIALRCRSRKLKAEKAPPRRHAPGERTATQAMSGSSPRAGP